MNLRLGNIDQEIIFLNKEIECKNYEITFKRLLVLKDYVHNNELWGTFYYKSIIFQMMAEICLKEGKSHHYFYNKCQSIVMDISKELVSNPPFFDLAEKIIMKIYKGEHIEQNESIFLQNTNKFFDNNEKFGKFIIEISVNLLLEFLIPKESHKYFFDDNPNDADRPTREILTEIVENNHIYKCTKYVKELDVFKTVSNITALSGLSMNKIIS